MNKIFERIHIDCFMKRKRTMQINIHDSSSETIDISSNCYMHIPDPFTPKTNVRINAINKQNIKKPEPKIFKWCNCHFYRSKNKKLIDEKCYSKCGQYCISNKIKYNG